MVVGTEQCQRDAGGGGGGRAGGGRAPPLISCFLLHQQDLFQHVTAKVNPMSRYVHNVKLKRQKPEPMPGVPSPRHKSAAFENSIT